MVCVAKVKRTNPRGGGGRGGGFTVKLSSSLDEDKVVERREEGNYFSCFFCSDRCIDKELPPSHPTLWVAGRVVLLF